MMSQRKHLYPPEWKRLASQCKQEAMWRCQTCHIRQGATRTSKRTGHPYRVWLHAAHVVLHDTLNPTPALKCLCPTCHGRYDYRQRQREARITLERHKHQVFFNLFEILRAEYITHMRKVRYVMASSHHSQSSRKGHIVVHKLLAEMTPDEAKAWIHDIRARLVRKQVRERAYLDRRAARGVHTPTDDVYEDDQQLETDLLALLDEMLSVETDEA